MSSNRRNDSTPEAMDAMKEYYANRPAPEDPKAWFDENYPDAARDALVELEEAADAIMDLIQQHDDPLPRERILRIMHEKWARPGWQFSDGSGIYLDAENSQLLWTRGYDKATRPVTPETVLESTLFFGILAGFGSYEDIRKAAVGPYRDHLHLLLESSDARLRERAIAILGEAKRETDTGK